MKEKRRESARTAIKQVIVTMKTCFRPEEVQNTLQHDRKRLEGT